MTHPAGPDESQEPIALRPLPWGWVIATFACVLVGVGALYALWDRVPDPMPIHWGARGQADNWVAKSFPAAAALVGLVPLILGVVTLGSLALMRSQAASAGDGFPKRTPVEVNRARATYNGMAVPLAGWMFLLAAFIAASITLDLTGGGGLGTNPWLMLAVILLSCVWFMWRMALLQQHIDREFPHPDPRYKKKWGIFYYNPEDPRLMVEESGMNTTFNFAHKGAWGIMAALCIPMIVIIILVAFAS